MNINSNTRVVLCFGDSNTWGQKPDKSGRFAVDVRWTGQLQKLLGDDFWVIEEGLGGRTTNLDHPSADKPGRNGRDYLLPAVLSHNPIDCIVVMLGTNDLKTVYARSAAAIAEAVRLLVADIKHYAATSTQEIPKIIIVSPIHIVASAKAFDAHYRGIYSQQSADESQKLAPALSELADSEGCSFIDASHYAQPGEDGIHMDQPSHRNFAGAIYRAISDGMRK